MRVAIVGGGIGGLAAAIGLQRAGADIRVFERAHRPDRAQGSGLSIFANGARALDFIGCGPGLQSISELHTSSLQTGQRRPDGRWITKTPHKAVAGLRVVHRGELSKMLTGQLLPGTVSMGSDVVSVNSDGRGIVVRGASGLETKHVVDLVIGADGIRSNVRRHLWAEEASALRYSGYTAWRAVTACTVDLHGAAGETWGRGKRFGIGRLRDGRVYWFGVASMDAGLRFANEHDAVRQHFVDWHEPITGLLRATNPADVLHHDIYDLAHPLSTFVKDGVALLGDAAHAMTADLGQGANQALEDAATLTALLAPVTAEDRPDRAAIAAALLRYDRIRRPRTQSIARQARMVGAIAQLNQPIAAAVRDLAMWLTPPSAIARSILAVQNWSITPELRTYRR